MNPKTGMMVKGLKGIILGGISVQDFCIAIDVDKHSAKNLLKNFVKNNIGKFENDVVNFESGDKLKAAIFAITNGATIDEVSIYLNWKDFEGLVAKILESKGFSIIRNFIMTKPRMEIDVIGINLGVAVLIDCKHWKRQSVSTIHTAVKKQIERVKHYVAKTQSAVAVPAIVTLYQEQVSFIDKVPIIPIIQFSSFVDEFYGNLDELKTIKLNKTSLCM